MFRYELRRRASVPAGGASAAPSSVALRELAGRARGCYGMWVGDRRRQHRGARHLPGAGAAAPEPGVGSPGRSTPVERLHAVEELGLLGVELGLGDHALLAELVELVELVRDRLARAPTGVA